MFKKLKESVKFLKKEIVPIYYALLDRRTPILAKLVAGLTVGYMLSPIDLIPDFIPVLGWLDDLVIVPLLIRLTLRLIPKQIIAEIKGRIDGGERLQKKWVYALPILILYGYLVFVLFKYARPWLGF